MITSTNKIYGFENEGALRHWLSEVTSLRGKTIKGSAFDKLIMLFRANKETFKLKLLKDYKIKFENINEPLDYFINDTYATTPSYSPSATLRLYIKNRKDTVIKNYDKNITEIKNADENYKKFLKAQKTINDFISDKDNKVDLISKFDVLSKETKDKLNEEKEKRDLALVEIDRFSAEVNARICDSQEPNAILKAYNIIDDAGKLVD